MDNRRLFLYLAISLAVYLAYQYVYNTLWPLPKTPATQPAPASSPAQQPATDASQPGPAATSAVASQAAFQFSAGASTESVILGGEVGDALRIELTPRGAAVAGIALTSRDGKGRLRYRTDADTNEPHTIVTPVNSPTGLVESFATHQIALRDVSQPWLLSGHVWEIIEKSSHHVVFSTTLQSAEAPGGVLRIVKRFELVDGTPLIQMRVSVENLSGRELAVQLMQDGPVGFPEEGRYYPTRRLLVTDRLSDGSLKMGIFQRSEIAKTGREGRDIPPSEENSRFAWLASVNKYFGVFIRPVSLVQGGKPDFIERVRAFTADPGGHSAAPHHDDTIGRMLTTWQPLQPGARIDLAFEIYAGPKGTEEMGRINPAFVDETQIGYSKSHAADASCCPCQFAWVTELMVWSLDAIYFVVRNYGIAILVLVIIVRTLLHPLAVMQQKSMYKLQDAMVRIQPKLQKIKTEFANDKQKLAQEQMRVYSEEGVNPMAPLVNMIPLFIQMPILIGLWTALNTNIQLRHAPFDGWWIRDLSNPDALIRFGGEGFTIPILGWLPWIGAPFQNISSLNVLPILMGVSMWLQQKYMPKPSLQAKKDAAAAAGPGPGGMSAEDQIRQQAMIANMMAIMFPIMFYYQPSGLALYWMFTNVFGIVESLIVRKQIHAEKERKERLGIVDEPKKKKPGRMAEFFKRMAEQAAELQKKADEISREEKAKKSRKQDKGGADDKGGRK